MILADTSVWIAHFRHGEPKPAERLFDGTILMHPWILGELACGNLKNRRAVLSDLNALPFVEVASEAEVLTLLEEHKLWGRGIGCFDVHILASALLSGSQLWTLDKRLAGVAHGLDLR